MTKKKYKALMTDVDGTLCINNLGSNAPSQKVIDTIKQASQKIHVGLATSRAAYVVNHITKVLPLKGPSVVSGGAGIIDLSTGKVLWEQALQKSDVAKICDVLNELNVKFILQNLERDIEYSKDALSNKIHKVLVFVTPEKAEEIINKLSGISTVAVHKVHSSIPNTMAVVATHVSATKQYGIFETAKILGIQTSEIIGIGDSYNDFPLLMACGLKVAMGNAIDELKEVADYIAPSVHEDGVADVINKFIL